MADQLAMEINNILQIYRKNKQANPKAYIMFFIKGSNDFYQQSVYLKDIIEISSISRDYLKIIYKDGQSSLKNVNQVFEFFFSLDPKDDEEKPAIRKNDSYTG